MKLHFYLIIITLSLQISPIYGNSYFKTLYLSPGSDTKSPVTKDLLLSKSPVQEDPTPYLLPANHRIASILKKIFSKSHVIANNRSFKKAGFVTLFVRKKASLRVAKHHALKGYLLKIYLEDEAGKHFVERQNRLIVRVANAANVRQFIANNNIQTITIADKWLYQLPSSAKTKKRAFVVVAQDMKLVSRKKCEAAWKTKATTRHLDELYLLLSHGYASLALPQNIPYTKSGKFACIDTEYTQRVYNLSRVKRYFSKSMAKYWDTILKAHGQ
ncbi:MAG: hypothetical protein JWO53_73 [Chlamydiia bacterium]|nr:hypothetical protein [Chlamydiia bacterium]